MSAGSGLLLYFSSTPSLRAAKVDGHQLGLEPPALPVGGVLRLAEPGAVPVVRPRQRTLALDRFGDWAAGDRVAAPVREVAAQALAALLGSMGAAAAAARVADAS